jgi:hypothetical protein
LTVCPIDFEPAWKLASLAMLALTVLEPACSALVVQVAAPPTSATDVQSAIGLVDPFSVVVKVTAPVGVMPVDGVIVAVKVTGALTVEDELEEERATVGATVSTVWVLVFEDAAVKLLSAARLALTAFDPASSALVVQAAFRLGPAPLTRDTEVQPGIALVIPFRVVLKLTFPVGVVPLAGETEAVNVTDWFTFDVDPLVARLSVGVPCTTVSVPPPEAPL